MPDFPESSPPLVNRLKTTPQGERPQERLERHGASALSDTELLAMLLRSGTQGQDVLTLASRLIAEAGSLSGLITWRATDFKKLKGIGHVKALQLLTVMEISRRVLAQGGNPAPDLSKAAAIVAFMQPLTHGLQIEKFWVLCLNSRNRLIKCVELTSGTATQTVVHPREVFKEALREGAVSISCVHNHPTGDPSPSSADMKITRQIRDTGAIMLIPLLDHVIIGSVTSDPAGLGYHSIRASGYI
jgi:DNA repair protein RadC